jgi:hypothetical protein
VAVCRRLPLEMALDMIRPGAGASDPGMVSPTAKKHRLHRRARALLEEGDAVWAGTVLRESGRG